MKYITYFFLISLGFCIGAWSIILIDEHNEKTTAPYEVRPDYVTYNIKSASIYVGEGSAFLLRADEMEVVE